MNYMQCECGAYHFAGRPFCEGCGAQPPRPRSTHRTDADADPETSPDDFCAVIIALTAALEANNGKWAVA